MAQTFEECELSLNVDEQLRAKDLCIEFSPQWLRLAVKGKGKGTEAEPAVLLVEEEPEKPRMDPRAARRRCASGRREWTRWRCS